MTEINLSQFTCGTEVEIELEKMKLDFEEMKAPTIKDAKVFLMQSLILLNEMIITYTSNYNFMDRSKIKVAIFIFQKRYNDIKSKDENDLFNKNR
jgi:hypothetical protein